MADPEAIFDQLDICRDGHVTQGELELVDILNHHLPLDIDVADARVQALFSEIDQDGSKYICKDQFIENWDTILADVLAPILVNFRKERLNPRIGNIDVEWKMMIEDVNKFEFSLCHMTVSADIELVKDSFWVRHGLYKKY
jgi:hypothetical protein